MITYKSFAKINLYLEIIGKRADGYHLLNSLMVLIDIFDIISIEKSDQFNLKINSANSQFSEENGLGNLSENIIIKTVNLLAEKYNFEPKINIILTKNIPVSAGLGGGSSNAACIILLLNQFYELNLKQEQMLDLGLKIGADVPFFIHSFLQKKPVLISGIGEILENFDNQFGIKSNKKNEQLTKHSAQELYGLSLIIINPKKPLLTKEVFNFFAKKNDEKNIYCPNLKPNKKLDIITLSKQHKNSLQQMAIELLPEIGLILDYLKQQPNCLFSRMSGSGATCFGVFESEKDLNNCFENFQKKFPDFYLAKSKFVV